MVDKLILVGGFLGSGKTTLLAEAAQRISGQKTCAPAFAEKIAKFGQGKSVGLITNDQAPDLVDTRLLTGIGNGVSEVAGSCFCCNFSGFVRAVQSLIDKGAKIIIAESVGSCTDLSATIVNPLKKFHPDWNLAPLTVLVDPKRLSEIFGKTKSLVDPDALYIMELQLAEADRILISKSDLLLEEEMKFFDQQSEPKEHLSINQRWARIKHEIRSLIEQHYPDKKPHYPFISSKSGEGIDGWLEDILYATDVGSTIVPVDYDRYAHGEAVLGWLNATATVPANTDGKKILADLLGAIHDEITKTNTEVGHIKALVNVGGKEWVGNLTSLRGSVNIRETESKLGNGILVLNARVQTSPDALETLVRDLCGKFNITIDSLRCLMPGYPTPTHRFSAE